LLEFGRYPGALEYGDYIMLHDVGGAESIWRNLRRTGLCRVKTHSASTSTPAMWRSLPKDHVAEAAP